MGQNSAVQCEGRYDIKLVVPDNAGNESLKDYNFNIDNKAPEINVMDNGNNTITSEGIKVAQINGKTYLKLNVTDNGTGVKEVKCIHSIDDATDQVDIEALFLISSVKAVTGKDGDGYYNEINVSDFIKYKYLYVRSEDNLGNVSYKKIKNEDYKEPQFNLKSTAGGRYSGELNDVSTVIDTGHIAIADLEITNLTPVSKIQYMYSRHNYDLENKTEKQALIKNDNLIDVKYNEDKDGNFALGNGTWEKDLVSKYKKEVEDTTDILTYYLYVVVTSGREIVGYPLYDGNVTTYKRKYTLTNEPRLVGLRIDDKWTYLTQAYTTADNRYAIGSSSTISGYMISYPDVYSAYVVGDNVTIMLTDNSTHPLFLHATYEWKNILGQTKTEPQMIGVDEAASLYNNDILKVTTASFGYKSGIWPTYKYLTDMTISQDQRLTVKIKEKE